MAPPRAGNRALTPPPPRTGPGGPPGASQRFRSGRRGGGRPALSSPTFSDWLPRPWLFPLLALGASWVVMLAGWRLANFYSHTTFGWRWYIGYKDAAFYVSIARSWYNQPSLTSVGVPITAAWFPVFPALIWLAAHVDLGNWAAANLIAIIGSGAAACVSVWALAARVGDRWLADRAVLLFCVFPGAMTFAAIYAEPLGVALTACSLLAAVNRKWLLSGLLALAATGEHPTLIVLAPALAIVAGHAIWTRRDWRSLLAPILAPWGMLGYFLWIATRYHARYTFWFTLERRGWGQKIDWGQRTFQVVTWTGRHMPSHADFYLMCDIMFWVLLAGTVLMLWARVPLPVSAFTILLFINAVISNGSGPRPRMVLPALGIFLGAAACLPRRLYWPVLALSAGGLLFIVGWWPHHPLVPPP